MNILALDLGKYKTVFCDYNSVNGEQATPAKMILASETAQAIMLPMLGAAVLYFRYRRSDENLRPSWLWDAMLWLSLAGFAVITA